MPIKTDYTDVTELSGDDVTLEQIDRICQRHYWAGHYCRGKDVVEVVYGSGQGLGYLNSLAKSFEGGDYSDKMIEIAKAHYGGQLNIQHLAAGICHLKRVLEYPDFVRDKLNSFYGSKL
jgi:hypothetical protein